VEESEERGVGAQPGLASGNGKKDWGQAKYHMERYDPAHLYIEV